MRYIKNNYPRDFFDRVLTPKITESISPKKDLMIALIYLGKCLHHIFINLPIAFQTKWRFHNQR